MFCKDLDYKRSLTSGLGISSTKLKAAQMLLFVAITDPKIVWKMPKLFLFPILRNDNDLELYRLQIQCTLYI